MPAMNNSEEKKKRRGKDYKINKQYFLIGSVTDGYADYDLFYDNEKNVVFFYDRDYDKVYDINLTIFGLIDKMEGI